MADVPEQLPSHPVEEPPDSGGMLKPFLEHLEDLRWALVKSLVAIGVTMTLCLVFVRQLLEMLEAPLKWSGLCKDKDVSEFLITTNVPDSITIAFKVGIFGGILLALPIVLYFAGQFILPALTRKEKTALWPTFTAGAVMFLLGAVCCYFFLLPQSLAVLYQFSNYLGFKAMWTIQSYMSFVIQFMIAMGVVAEVPVIILLLAKLGIIHHTTLRHYRRHAIVVILIGTAFIIPTSDALSLALVAGPLILMYEICVWITWWMDRQRAREKTA